MAPTTHGNYFGQARGGATRQVKFGNPLRGQNKLKKKFEDFSPARVDEPAEFAARGSSRGTGDGRSAARPARSGLGAAVWTGCEGRFVGWRFLGFRRAVEREFHEIRLPPSLSVLPARKDQISAQTCPRQTGLVCSYFQLSPCLTKFCARRTFVQYGNFSICPKIFLRRPNLAFLLTDRS